MQQPFFSFFFFFLPSLAFGRTGKMFLSINYHLLSRARVARIRFVSLVSRPYIFLDILYTVIQGKCNHVICFTEIIVMTELRKDVEVINIFHGVRVILYTERKHSQQGRVLLEVITVFHNVNVTFYMVTSIRNISKITKSS